MTMPDYQGVAVGRPLFCSYTAVKAECLRSEDREFNRFLTSIHDNGVWME